jgi:hypothetical protein
MRFEYDGEAGALYLREILRVARLVLRAHVSRKL